MTKKRLLLIFVKNPELGKCKTRLAATIGDQKALAFYKEMLERTKEMAGKVNATKAVFYSQFIDHEDLWPENDTYIKQLQNQGDLGAKMLAAFEWGFAEGYESICIIGSDCYALTAEIVNDAFNQLEQKEAVIGPSTDGGYYLLGMNTLIPALFQQKNWSTETVTPDTEADLKRLQKSYCFTIPLTDIDTEEDLRGIDDEAFVNRFI